VDADEFEDVLQNMETLLDRLRALYEQHFQGIERLEPTVPRKELDRGLDRLRRNVPRNTALRFRYHMLVQKYTTYQTYWKRIARQIEEGTYRRDLMKARQKREDARSVWENRVRGGDNGDIEVDVDVALSAGDNGAPPALDDEVTAALKALEPAPSVAPKPRPQPSLSPFALPKSLPPREREQSSASPANGPPPSKTFKRPAATTPPAPSPPRANAASDDAGMDEARMRRLYDSYVDARRKNNERVDNVRYETVQKSVEKMLPGLREKHKGKDIDFEVVVRDGKVGLKPVAR
jgi:hypothetical protein